MYSYKENVDYVYFIKSGEVEICKNVEIIDKF
jgi:hypothetical protein